MTAIQEELCRRPTPDGRTVTLADHRNGDR